MTSPNKKELAFKVLYIIFGKLTVTLVNYGSILKLVEKVNGKGQYRIIIYYSTIPHSNPNSSLIYTPSLVNRSMYA
jgi:hypothetical protein